MSDKTQQEMVDWLLQRSSFEWTELQSLFKKQMTDQQFGLLFHAAREQLRTEMHVEFITRSFDQPGLYFRANDDQKLNRGQNFARTAMRKQMRAGRVLDAVNEYGLSEERRPVLQRMKDKLGHIIMRGQQIMSSRDPIPTAVPARPDVPRRHVNNKQEKI